jgi:hypothetical protein
MFVGSVVLVAAVVSVLTPKATHGLVAALVQISNTAAAPAITLDVSKLSSQNVQLFCGQVCLQILPDGTYGAQKYIVPVGSSLVITTVQINTASSGGTGDISLFQQVDISGQSSLRGTWTFAAGGTFQFQYPSGIVLSAGSNLLMYPISLPFGEAFLTGYLVSN